MVPQIGLTRRNAEGRGPFGFTHCGALLRYGRLLSTRTTNTKTDTPVLSQSITGQHFGEVRTSAHGGVEPVQPQAEDEADNKHSLTEIPVTRVQRQRHAQE